MCKLAQSKHISRFHKSHLIRKLQEKCLSPEPLPTLCVSLRSGNAREDFIRATLYGNLQENAGPRTATRTLCEPAQSKRMSRFHKSHFIRTFTGKMPGPRTATHPLCEPVQSKRMSRFHKSHFIRKFTGKMLQTRTATRTLCEPAQSKRMSRFHKSHFIRTFTGKMPGPRVSTLIKHRPLHLP